jgi:hypothetical protein
MTPGIDASQAVAAAPAAAETQAVTAMPVVVATL